MGLDSVEIIMRWEDSFGIVLSNDEAFVLRTPRMAIDLIATKLSASNGSRGACLTLRAFHRLRHSITSAANIRRDTVRLNARLRELVTSDRRRTWDAVRSTSGISSLRGLGWFSPGT